MATYTEQIDGGAWRCCALLPRGHQCGEAAAENVEALDQDWRTDGAPLCERHAQRFWLSRWPGIKVLRRDDRIAWLGQDEKHMPSVTAVA